MTSIYADWPIDNFVKYLTIRQPITFGMKVLDKTITGPESTFPANNLSEHYTNAEKRHLEKTVFVLLRFLLAGDKYTTIEQDAVTALRGIVDDEIIDARLKTVSNIIALDKNSIDAVYRLTAAYEHYWPRVKTPIVLVPVIIKIVGWLYEQITQDAQGGQVYLPVLKHGTQDLKNVFVTQRTVWSIDLWATRLRVYSPRQAMCLLGLLTHPLQDYRRPGYPSLPDCSLAFTPEMTLPWSSTQIGVLCPKQLTRYVYPEERIPPLLPKRWADTFERYRSGMPINA